MKPSLRVVIVSIAILLPILLLNTCGLESFLELSPPTSLVKLGDAFRFQKTSDNSETAFIGFDLYYKFFDPGSAPDLGYIIQFDDLISGTNPFRRIHASDDDEGTPPPLMYVQPDDRTPGGSATENDTFIITVDFTSIADPFPKIVGQVNPYVDYSEIEHTDIRRGVWDGSEYKRFSDFSAGDADINYLTVDIAGGESVQFVLYAVSYGYDTVNYRQLYSEPVQLGIIERTFP
jgi:hypothetical protein